MIPDGGFNLVLIPFSLKTNSGFKSIEESDDVWIKTVTLSRESIEFSLTYVSNPLNANVFWDEWHLIPINGWWVNTILFNEKVPYRPEILKKVFNSCN